MLLFSYAITLQEVPGEISLTLNISQCKFNCTGCHTPELKGDNGSLITGKMLNSLIDLYTGISVVTFMGGDQFPKELEELLELVKSKGLKTCLYTGAKAVPQRLSILLDFLKVGEFREELGGLPSKNTNQRLYNMITGEDLTYKFRSML